MEDHSENHDADSLICAHAFSGERPILFVYREPDGFWTFTCGSDDHSKKTDVVPVCHGCALDENNLRNALGNLRPGWEANRTNPDEPWSIAPTDAPLDS